MPIKSETFIPNFITERKNGMNSVIFTNVNILAYKKGEGVLETGKTSDDRLYCHFIIKELRYKKSPATYHCSAFGKVAEQCMNMNLVEGDQISIFGELDPYINIQTKRMESRIIVEKLDYAIKKADILKNLDEEKPKETAPMSKKINLTENDLFFKQPEQLFR